MEEMINEKLKISTMTYLTQIDSNIDLQQLYNSLSITENIKYIEYGKNIPKGFKVKKIKNPRKKVERKYFYNQITLHVFLNKIINVKVFNNGKIQMTGVKSDDQGKGAANIVLQEFKTINSDKKEIIFDNQDFDIKEFRTAMINSDFDIGFKINREMLHRIVINNGYYSSFEPSIYP